MSDRAIVTCALNGVLTNPKTHPVPYTPEDMAQSARDAHDAGAAVVHIHFREQQMGRMPTWEPDLCAEIVDAIRAEVPGIIINTTTGTVGSDISGPKGVLERVKPEMAAMNSGSLNYLKTRSNGDWAWPPMLFDNPVDKIQRYLDVMRDHDITPRMRVLRHGYYPLAEDVRGQRNARPRIPCHLVQGVASGMPAREDLLPILVDEAPDGAHWQSIVIGRDDVWPLHRKTAEMGGHLRTGVEDTYYLPDGEKVTGNGPLIEQVVTYAREAGREPATPDEAREIFAAL